MMDDELFPSVETHDSDDDEDVQSANATKSKKPRFGSFKTMGMECSLIYTIICHN
jgi:hypothetical protein